MNTLVSIAYSPWSQRAKTALRACKVPFRMRAFIPAVSEPRLRLELRDPFGKLTVPVLLRRGAPPLRDSFDIARFAAEQGDPAFLSDENVEETRRITALAERVLSEGRLRTTRSVIADDEALRESLPGAIRLLGPVGVRTGRKLAGKILEKYPSDHDGRDGAREAMREALKELSDARASGTVFGDRLTYADVVIAYGLEFVKPRERCPIGPASREHWTDPVLAEEFSELLTWRDETLATLRSS